MRSAAVFFSKRHAMRAGQGSRSAEAKSRRSSVAVPRADRRAELRPARSALSPARIRTRVAHRPQTRARPTPLVPRGFLPLRIH
jgi:hypothetical protein